MSTPLPTGYVGNLTSEEEAKLKEFWTALFKLFGVADAAEEKQPISPTTTAETPASDSKKPKRKLGLFSKKDGSESPRAEENGTKNTDPDDKYGQAKEFQNALATHSPEELRIAFWSMVKQDHPDSLLLRFLRARKWDVNRAVIMLISALHWRANAIHLDDKIMSSGDAGALEGLKSSDPAVKKESEDFLSLLRLGESFIHGKDKAGRPVCYIRVRLHKAGTHCESALERYTVYLIETSRLLLEKPVETAALVFDMTDFSLANMDYAPVKFMIKCFEANYPESLGVILVHKAPWVFSGIWTIIKGWLDPVVASKVHFTKTSEELETYISRSQLIKEIGGDNPYAYKYIEPETGENTKQKDVKSMNETISKRFQYASEFQLATKAWITTDRSSFVAQNSELMKKRDDLASRLYDNYWRLDPFIRARSLYDRLGAIQSNQTPKKGLPSRTTSVRTHVSEKPSFEVITTRPILVDGNGDEVD
ncbi:conserved hypothetical protein [Uncinocarpus reesii 1704]|uniref:CRAL-TRIO domain-containing protein n=1 Tax=Uncinocarpus reesii (strain UAMH 1704) TaxID=336963 RepID=C4JSH8_UNCRE|nr:uncharacterized protein UREG_05417 [Uncinocarpus reesii 1704]EEP80575.1 conserved hypothetical protein [Uncinocarpus reesii 1704]